VVVPRHAVPQVLDRWASNASTGRATAFQVAPDGWVTGAALHPDRRQTLAAAKRAFRNIFHAVTQSQSRLAVVYCNIWLSNGERPQASA